MSDLAPSRRGNATATIINGKAATMGTCKTQFLSILSYTVSGPLMIKVKIKGQNFKLDGQVYIPHFDAFRYIKSHRSEV